jgi:multiple sugar transport system permease protein
MNADNRYTNSTAEAAIERRSARGELLSRVLRGDREGLLFVSPTILLLIIVVFLPIVAGVYLSFQNATATTSTFNGLDNYAYLLARSAFWNALGNTITFTAISVTAHFVLGMFTALLVNENIRGRMVFRVSLLMPWVLAPVIVGLTWKWLYDPIYGVLNFVLQQLHIIENPVTWLGNSITALPAVLITNAWHGFPFMMVMLLAGLQAIPNEEYEAAMIDGASAWQRFFYITIPNLRYVMMIAITLDTIWQFRTFDVIEVMTAGGPAGSTEILSTLIYREMFSNFRFGLASAIGIVMLAITTLLSLVYLSMLRSAE